MTTYDELCRDIERAKAHVEKRQRQLAIAQANCRDAVDRLERSQYPIEPGGGPDDQPVVITFTKWFGRSTPYHFGAIRVRGTWWISGRDGSTPGRPTGGCNWERLVEFVLSNEGHLQEQKLRALRSIHRWQREIAPLADLVTVKFSAGAHP